MPKNYGMRANLYYPGGTGILFDKYSGIMEMVPTT